jgi:hypothetical protein
MLRYFGAARIRAIAATRGRNVSGVGHVVVPHVEAPAAEVPATAPPVPAKKRRGRQPKPRG